MPTATPWQRCPLKPTSLLETRGGSLLDQRLPSLPAVSQQNIQRVSSFEMIALWVAAGYGVGVSAQSRIEHAQGWGIHTRPLSDGPYEIVTHLQRPCGQADVVSERFERRALQVAKNAPT